MSDIAIDINLLELGEDKNPFEELASKIERLSLEGRGSGELERLEQTLLFIERKFQDLQDTDSDKSKVLIQAVNANLLLLEAQEVHSFEAISKNLEKIKDVSIGLSNTAIDNIESYILSNVIRDHGNHTSQITSKELFDAYNFIFNGHPDQAVIKNEWIIELNFKTTKQANHKPLEFINTLIEGLNTIPGVQVTLEDIKIGSIQAKLKAVFDDVTSKEEVKEVLESARKFAKGKLEKEYSELEKTNSETIKNNIQSEILQENLQFLKSDENKDIKKLESESLRYDIEKKKIENERLRLQLFKERKELLKELLIDGLISQRDLEILVKGIPFLKIENGTLTAGENIDIIDNL